MAYPQPPAVFETKTRADVFIFTLVRMGVEEGAADGALSNGVSGTKLDFVQFYMLTVSPRGHRAQSLMAHNPDFTV